MGRTGLFMILVAVIITGCNGKNISNNNPGHSNTVINLQIVQNDREIEITDNTAELKRNSFSLIFKFNVQDSLLVNASYTPDTFNKSKSGVPISQLSAFQGTAAAEELFNRNQSLFISDKTPGLWYFTSESDHRFNRATQTGSYYICQRDIKKIINLDQENTETDIIDVTEDNIYLVFIKSRWNEDFTKRIELSRRVLRIKFSI